MRRALVLSALGVAIPGLAVAAPPAEHGPAWGMLAAAIFNLGILGFLLFRFAGPPIQNFMIQRSRGIARAIEEADARLREASVEVERWRERLSGLDREIEEIAQRIREQTEIEREQRLDRARATGQRIRQEADALAEFEVRQAADALRVEVAELATRGALGLLREMLRPEDDRRLISEYVDRIGAAS